MTGPELRAAMVAQEWSCVALADALQVSVSTVESWRMSRRRPCCVHHARVVSRVVAGPSPAKIKRQLQERRDLK